MMLFNNTWCVAGNEIIKSFDNPNGMPKGTYDAMVSRGKLNVLKRGCYKQPALIELYTIPEPYRTPILSRLGDPLKTKPLTLLSLLKPDEAALTFYSTHPLADATTLKAEFVNEYCINAQVINALRDLYATNKAERQKTTTTMRSWWSCHMQCINAEREAIGHTLPRSESQFRRVYESYVTQGYSALISKRFCNANTRKVTGDIENLLMSLYTLPNKPYTVTVSILYDQFIAGSLQVVDKKTGELFNPQHFINRKGEPIVLSESTVRNYINQPYNRAILDAKRSGQHYYQGNIRPHAHRHKPVFSFSKISMDDLDLRRLLDNGQRVKAYYSFDMASQCIVGAAHSRHKNEELYLECMRDMFRFIEREGFGMPMEVEVENHLVSKFFDELAMMFPYVRICKPGNSREKGAEHLIKQKRYGVEKQMLNEASGRHYSKLEANRIDRDREGAEYAIKKFSYEKLVADDLEFINAFNNAMHPNQERYPGLTRMQVLRQHINPKLTAVNKALVYQSIGFKVQTSIQRYQYVTVQYGKYALPEPEVLKRLQAHNLEVEACYLPDAKGVINEVYIYQNGKFLCTCAKIETFADNKAEWIEGVDDAKYQEQMKYISSFDKHIKEGKEKLITPVLLNTEDVTKADEAELIIVPTNYTTPEINYEELLKNYDPQAIKDRARHNI